MTYRNHVGINQLEGVVRTICAIRGEQGYVTETGAAVIRAELAGGLARCLNAYPFHDIPEKAKTSIAEQLLRMIEGRELESQD